MAYVPAQNTRNATSNGANESWKNDGFLNMSLPTQNGGKAKVGAIGLRLDNSRAAGLIAAFEKDPAKATAWFLANVEIEYRSAKPVAGSDYAIEI